MVVNKTILFFIVLFSISPQIVLSDVFSSHWESYPEEIFPSMYKQDSFLQCEKQQGTFCKLKAAILANDENSTIAKEILKSEHSPNRFFRSTIYRMKCIPKHIMDSNAFGDFVRREIEEELKDYNVSLNGAVDYSCNIKWKFNIYDGIFISIVLGIELLIFKGTAHYMGIKKQISKPPSKYYEYLEIFSIQENWKQIIRENKNPDFQTLKFLQGLRVLNTIMIIMCHTIIALYMGFLDNPQDVEKIYTVLLNKKLQMDMFILQMSFLISTFLMTNQIYEIHNSHGYFSLMHCFKLYINRIFRFLPTTAIMIIVTFPITKILPQGNSLIYLTHRNYNNCVTSWWMTLLQLNVFNAIGDMCLGGTWYLSTHTFFNVSVIALLYIQLKLRLDIKKVLGLAFVLTTLNYGYIIYSNNEDIMCRPSPQGLRMILHEVTDFQQLYTSPFSSWNTSWIGVAFGAIYFHTKNKKIKMNTVLKTIWLVVFISLPVLTVYMSTYDYEGIFKAIVGSLLKPMYALGFGVGILGMAYGSGGFIKTFLEWDFFVKIGKFTYCTYVFHFFIVFAKPLFSQRLYHYSNSDLVINMIQDIIMSFAVGIVGTVQWEYPGLRLQKMLIPQIQKPTDEEVIAQKTE